MSIIRSLSVFFSRIVGILLIGSGTWGLIDEVYFSHVFGIPHTTATNELTIFYPGIAGRNLAAGMGVLAVSLFQLDHPRTGAGARKALGTFLFWWTITGYADTWILVRHPLGENIGVHLFNIVMITLTGLGLIYG